MSSSSTALISFVKVLLVTVVLSLRARERSSRRILDVSRFTPSMRYTSSSITALRYSKGSKAACSIGNPKLPGQPPRIISSISFFRSTSPVNAGVNSPWHSFSKETFPQESPDSYRDIGRIRSLAIRPAPLCRMPLWLGVAEPVRMNCPFSATWSTLYRTASQMEGTSCHSSIRRGVSPSSTKAGDSSASWRFWKLLAGSPM